MKLGQKQNRQTIIDIRSMARSCPSTLAVTSCECERSISHLRIHKTLLRGTIPETRLMHGLTLLCTRSQTLHVMLQLLSMSMKRTCTRKNHSSKVKFVY